MNRMRSDRPALATFVFQLGQKGCVFLGRAAHHDTVDVIEAAAQVDHRVDKSVGALLVADAAITPQQQTVRQPQTGANGGFVLGWREILQVDAVHDHLRVAFQIPGGLARRGDHRIHPVDQPFGIPGMGPLRGAGEQQFQPQSEDVAQDQTQQHLGVSPCVPDAQGFAVRQERQAAQRDMRGCPQASPARWRRYRSIAPAAAPAAQSSPSRPKACV